MFYHPILPPYLANLLCHHRCHPVLPPYTDDLQNSHSTLPPCYATILCHPALAGLPCHAIIGYHSALPPPPALPSYSNTWQCRTILPTYTLSPCPTTLLCHPALPPCFNLVVVRWSCGY